MLKIIVVIITVIMTYASIMTFATVLKSVPKENRGKDPALATIIALVLFFITNAVNFIFE